MNYWVMLATLVTLLGALAGLMRHSLRAVETSIEQRFDAVDKRFDAVDKRFDSVDVRIDRIEEKVEYLDRKFDKKFDDLDKKFDVKIDAVKDQIVALALLIDPERYRRQRTPDINQSAA